MVIFVQQTLCVSDLEDGEVLTTVKVEPLTSDDEDCRHAPDSRRRKRFVPSSSLRCSQRDIHTDRLPLDMDFMDSVAGVPASTDVGNSISSSTVQRQSARSTTGQGQPGLTTMWSCLHLLSDLGCFVGGLVVGMLDLQLAVVGSTPGHDTGCCFLR